MKVKDLKPGELSQLMKKTIRVRAVGEPDVYVGYYNHLRRRGGDVFVLRPVVRKRIAPGFKDIKTGVVTKAVKEEILITAEQQFSSRWMQRVNANAAETAPLHFNVAGRGRKRLDIPGMTHKLLGEDDNTMGDESEIGNVQTESEQNVNSEVVI